MTTKDEAIKLAREALESCNAGDYSTGHVIYPSFDEDAVNKAIEAIEALNAPLAEQPAPATELREQEPAFYRHEDGHLMTPSRAKFLGLDLNELQPLYTSPPAQRTWVGLTDKQMFEMVEIAWRHGWASCRDAEYVGEEAEDERWGMVGAEVVQDIAAHGIKENT